MIPSSKNKTKLKVQVLAGGLSHERDISLKSGRRVADALSDQGATVIMREPDHDLLENIRKDRPDVIWPVLHGATGEDGSLRDILAQTKVPFVGASGSAARLAWDKSIAKILVERTGVATPAWVTLPKEAFKELDVDGVLEAIGKSLALPVVVKPARSGSAHGVTVVTEPNQLSRAMIDAYVYCDVAIIEKFVVGTELAISIVDLGAGPIALPAVEVEAIDGFYGYEERYTAGETNYYVPARLSKSVSEKAARLAVDIHELLGLRHLSRIDLIVDKKGVPWFLEANVVPGMTDTSLLPQAILAEGSTLGEVYFSIAKAAQRGRG